MKLRYQTHGGWSPWITCQEAEILDGCVRVVVDDDHVRIIPLHVVAGEIEVSGEERESTDE